MFQPRDPRHEPQGAFAKFTKYFSLVMTLVYPAIGVFIFFSSDEQVRLDPTVKKILGAVLVIYGVIRAVRVYQQHFKAQNRFRDKE